MAFEGLSFPIFIKNCQLFAYLRPILCAFYGRDISSPFIFSTFLAPYPSNPIIAGSWVSRAQFVVELAGFVAAVVAVASALPAPVLESWGCFPALRLQFAGRAGVVAGVAVAESEAQVAVCWLLPPRHYQDPPGSTPLCSAVAGHSHWLTVRFQMPG